MCICAVCGLVTKAWARLLFYMCSCISGSLNTLNIVADYKFILQFILMQILGGVWVISTVSNPTFEAQNSTNVLEERETAFSVGLLAVIIITCR